MAEIILIIIIGAVLSIGLVMTFLRVSRIQGNKGNVEAEELKKQVDALNAEKSSAGTKINLLGEQVRNLTASLEEKEKTIIGLNREVSQLNEKNKGLEEKYQTKLTEITQAEEKLQVAFKNLANEILEEKTKKFTEQNRSKLEEILKPLGDKIKEFEKKVDETYDKESKQRFSLEKEIKTLADMNRQISEDAQNLTHALRLDPKKQGNWGELVLDKVLESSGLTKGVEYIREFSTRSDEGDKYRPDVIINLPDNKHIIIDSKVSLNSYSEFVNTDDAAEKEKFLKLHLLSIRNHIRMLGEKGYQMLDAFDTPDYVLLFMPIESAFSLALQNDAELFSFAWDKNVVIVSPTTLLATLRTIASIWKHEKQTQNAIEIAKQGGLLYDKFVSFLADLEKVGSQLDTVKKSYDEAHKKLSSGSGNLIGKVEKLKELGARASKSLPRNLLDKAEESED
ncbi:MAG: DNA recombination protein RmuC [Bacteroidetes bacterium]|nr:DNA recombination protein RmuC [Bacteroidota bacterium]